MSLLPVGSKKIILYQLEAFSKLPKLAKIIVVLGEEHEQIQEYLEQHFLPSHKEYPHQLQFIKVSDLSNTYTALQAALNACKGQYRGYLVILGDTINSVPLVDLVAFHEKKKSDLSLLIKIKKELGEQEKKAAEGELETEIDNILVGEEGELLFIDMADEIDNNGVNIHPTIFKRVKCASFKKVVDSKTYLFNPHLANILRNLTSDEIYDVKPWLIQLIVQNQTNQRFLSLGGVRDVQPLRIYAHVSEQDTYIKKINSKKIY